MKCRYIHTQHTKRAFWVGGGGGRVVKDTDAVQHLTNINRSAKRTFLSLKSASTVQTSIIDGFMRGIEQLLHTFFSMYITNNSAYSTW